MNSVSRKLCRNRRFLCLATLLAAGILICVKQLAQSRYTLLEIDNHEPDLAFRENFLRHLVWASGTSVNATTSCRNTVQGRRLLCDEHGFVCPRDQLKSNGCCPVTSVQFHCDKCIPTSCCSQYEHCVSCCLKPSNKAALSSFVRNAIVSLEQLFGQIQDQFELCLSKCRTSSMSVQHENTYRDPDFKYCFGSDAPTLKV